MKSSVRSLETLRLKNIDIVDACIHLGLQPNKTDKTKWSGISISSEGLFYDFAASKGGKGAVDLVIHVLGCSTKQAFDFLRDHFSSNGVTVNSLAQKKMKVKNKPKTLVMPPRSKYTDKVKKYLMLRGIDKSTVDKMIELRTLYQDLHNNAVFIMGSTEGAEIVGTGKTKYKRLAKGSNKSTWFATTTTNNGKIAVCESAIDAISYTQMTNIKAVSSAGAPSSAFIARLGAYCADNSIKTVVCAYDNDLAGQRFTDKTMAGLFNVNTLQHLPKHHDFNDDIIMQQQ